MSTTCSPPFCASCWLEFEGSRPPADAPLRLGLTLAAAHVTIAVRESVGLPPAAGLLVRAVGDGGLGARAGIRTGDVLMTAGDRELRSVAALYAAADDATRSRRLTVGLVRGTDEHEVTVRLGEAGSVAGSRAATAGRSARDEHEV